MCKRKNMLPCQIMGQPSIFLGYYHYYRLFRSTHQADQSCPATHLGIVAHKCVQQSAGCQDWAPTATSWSRRVQLGDTGSHKCHCFQSICKPEKEEVVPNLSPNLSPQLIISRLVQSRVRSPAFISRWEVANQGIQDEEVCKEHHLKVYLVWHLS